VEWQPSTAEIMALVFAIIFAIVPWSFSEMPIAARLILWSLAWLLVLWVTLSAVAPFRLFALPVKVFLSTGLTCLLVASLWSWTAKTWTEEKAQTLKGELIAGDDGRDHSTELPVLQFGPTGASLPPWSGPVDTPMIQAYYDKILIKRVNGKLELTTTVRDDNKNVIVDVDRNHWTVSPEKSVSWDHNYTKDSLEVMDGKKRIVFQVKVLPDRIQLQQEWQWNKGAPSGGISQEGKYTEKEGIKPIFKYPSEEFWSQLGTSPY